jgi:hypothetical protein
VKEKRSFCLVSRGTRLLRGVREGAVTYGTEQKDRKVQRGNTGPNGGLGIPFMFSMERCLLMGPKKALANSFQNQTCYIPKNVVPLHQTWILIVIEVSTLQHENEGFHCTGRYTSYRNPGCQKAASLPQPLNVMNTSLPTGIRLTCDKMDKSPTGPGHSDYKRSGQDPWSPLDALQKKGTLECNWYKPNESGRNVCTQSNIPHPYT